MLALAVRVQRRVQHDSRPLFIPPNQPTPAINRWRQTRCFKAKSVGLESAAFIYLLGAVTICGHSRAPVGKAHCVCPHWSLTVPCAHRGARALDVQISSSSDYFRNINSVLYLIQMQGSPPPTSLPPICCLIVGVHFLKRRLV